MDTALNEADGAGPRTENEARAWLQAAAGRMAMPVWIALRWDRSGAQGYLCLDQTGPSGDTLQWCALAPSGTHALLLADGGFRVILRCWDRACIALSLMFDAPGHVPGFHPLLGATGLPVAPHGATPDALLATLELGVIDDQTAACLLPGDGLFIAAQEAAVALRQAGRFALAAAVWLDLPDEVRERLSN